MTENIVEKQNIPPVDRKIWLCLRNFALRKTEEENRLVTQGEVVEKAIMDYIEKNSK